MKRLLPLFVILALCIQCTRNPDTVDKYTLAPLPGWTAAYSDPGDIRYFDLDKLMADYSLTRYQAAEVQNGYRDLTRPSGFAPIAASDKENFFKQALDRVKEQGSFEESLSIAKLGAAKFIVVFDLDNTLYELSSAPDEACADATFESGALRHKVTLKLAPGGEEVIRFIHQKGGVSVFFTAATDALARENLAHWMFDSKPILQSDAVAGLLTHSHLTLGPKEKEYEPRVVHAKDLRLIDPSLKRSVLIDNNPTLVFQPLHLRVVPPFHAHGVCKPVDATQASLYRKVLSTVKDEIDETLRYQATHKGVEFSAAFLPYTEMGRLVVDALSKIEKMSEAAARDKVRQVPALVPTHY
jgi:hypothetical protein